METSNIEHRTLNIQRCGIRQHWKFGVRCSMFSVLLFTITACLGAGFAVSLKAGEPSISSPDNVPSNTVAVASATAVTNAPPRLRAFSEADLLELLTATIQQEYVKDKGELDLRLSRPWTSRNVPDEPLTIKTLDMPANGVSTTFILRFELRTAGETLGTWQSSVQARVWRDVWVARSAVKRGELVADADLEHQRRDVLTMHESLAEFSPGDTTLELAEPLQRGSPLLARSLKVRPVIRRGQSADALVQDGALSITMKVEALEDGTPGQTIRARNLQTRRDIRGKVLDEQTIRVSL